MGTDSISAGRGLWLIPGEVFLAVLPNTLFHINGVKGGVPVQVASIQKAIMIVKIIYLNCTGKKLALRACSVSRLLMSWLRASQMNKDLALALILIGRIIDQELMKLISRNISVYH